VRLLGLPVEEWLFFLVVPLCGLLTYEAFGVRRKSTVDADRDA